jgi:hypothetical protein
MSLLAAISRKYPPPKNCAGLCKSLFVAVNAIQRHTSERADICISRSFLQNDIIHDLSSMSF